MTLNEKRTKEKILANLNFEEKLKSFFNEELITTTNSATSALHLVMHMLKNNGLGPEKIKIDTKKDHILTTIYQKKSKTLGQYLKKKLKLCLRVPQFCRNLLGLHSEFIMERLLQ